MNDELNELNQKLERATAPAGVSAGSDFDPESIALRDTWLAFGRLLEAADRAGQKDGLPALKASMPKVAVPLDAVSPVPRWASKQRWLTAALMVAAASIAAVFVVVGLQWSGAAHHGASTPSEVVKTTTLTPAQIKTTEPVVNPTSVAVAAKKAAASAQWDDPDGKQIDEEITAVRLDISLTQRKWDQQSEATQAIGYRINEDEQEIEKGSL